jgi:hypothetical protein
MAAMCFAGMELGVPPAPTGLCAALISIYKTTSYILFDKRSPVVQTPRYRAANWVLKDQDRRMG